MHMGYVAPSLCAESDCLQYFDLTFILSNTSLLAALDLTFVEGVSYWIVENKLYIRTIKHHWQWNQQDAFMQRSKASNESISCFAAMLESSQNHIWSISFTYAGTMHKRRRKTTSSPVASL